MKSGIYMIRCKETGKIYIGKSVNVKSRYQCHLADLKREKHGNPYMQNAFQKHGKDAFEFIIVQYCEKEKLLEREYFWMEFYESRNPEKGFNIIFDCKKEQKKEEVTNTDLYKKNMADIVNKRWSDPKYAKKNIEAIQKAHEERKARGETLSCLTEESKKKAYESCHTEKFLKGLSERTYKQLEDPEYRALALKNLEKGRNSPITKEKIKKFRERQKTPEYKAMMAEKTRASWNDPEKKANRTENIKLALARKRNGK